MTHAYTYTVTSPVKYPCFDDVLLEPSFSRVRSRQDVDTSVDFLGLKLSLPVTNSNMDTIASPQLSEVLARYGSVSFLHRFCTIDENVSLYKQSKFLTHDPIVSVGVTSNELFRATALYNAGARMFFVDVAHAANIAVVEMYNCLTQSFQDAKFIVGNFGTKYEVAEFLRHVSHRPDAICVGIGGGSMCLTRVVTGVGVPTLASILDCAGICDDTGIQMMVNGGLRNSGDIVKALAAGADLVMLGSMFAGTNEAAGKLNEAGTHKEYRGSASFKSYEVQGKIASWRAPEGDSTWVPNKGPAINVLESINGGLRSAFSYLDAFNINELRAHAQFTYVTSNTVLESKAHGK